VRDGIRVSRKRLLRVMREHALLSVLASAGITVEDLRSSSDVPVVPASALGVTGWGQT
jgi:hypothetical protein